jgi:hypothetical protein
VTFAALRQHCVLEVDDWPTMVFVHRVAGLWWVALVWPVEDLLVVMVEVLLVDFKVELEVDLPFKFEADLVEDLEVKTWLIIPKKGKCLVLSKLFEELELTKPIISINDLPQQKDIRHGPRTVSAWATIHQYSAMSKKHTLLSTNQSTLNQSAQEDSVFQSWHVRVSSWTFDSPWLQLLPKAWLWELIVVNVQLQWPWQLQNGSLLYLEPENIG